MMITMTMTVADWWGMTSDEDKEADPELSFQGCWSTSVEQAVRLHVARLHKSQGFIHFNVRKIDVSSNARPPATPLPLSPSFSQVVAGRDRVSRVSPCSSSL